MTRNNSQKSEWVFLSYKLENETPGYGGQVVFEASSDKSIAQGDSCNTSRWELSNHAGTHIDFPRHFSSEGKCLDGYSADFFVFDKVALIDVSPVEPGQILTWEDLKSYPIDRDVELLLIKTGFCELRDQDVYWEANPGFHPELAASLREHFPRLKVLGFDSISVSSFVNRSLGREAHRVFLDHSQPILLVEDMNLSVLTISTHFERVIVSPVRVVGADASPCTVIAEVIQ